MKKILVDTISGTMILAKEIRGKSGNVLLNKGALLSTALGKRLKNWGIASVFIEGDDDSTFPAVPTQQPEEIRENLERKFNKVMHSPVMKAIFAATYQFKSGRGD